MNLISGWARPFQGDYIHVVYISHRIRSDANLPISLDKMAWGTESNDAND